jgi:hypothetical protein
MASYTARGLRLRYQLVGDGRPLVLLHGLSNHGLAWHRSWTRWSPPAGRRSCPTWPATAAPTR